MTTRATSFAAIGEVWPRPNGHYEYEPTFIMRGLTSLHVEFDPV